MEGNARTWFTPRQQTELWERWKSGQCVADIARALERRNKSGVYRVLALNGGIAPASAITTPRSLGLECGSSADQVNWSDPRCNGILSSAVIVSLWCRNSLRGSSRYISVPSTIVAGSKET
jgi:hypothetical protein